MRRIIAGTSAGAAVGLIAAGVFGVAGFADAAPPRPSAHVCAVWSNGSPYVGPLTLATNEPFWIPRPTLNTSPRGCMTFTNLKPRMAYQAVVSDDSGPCAQSTRPDGTIYKWGTQTQTVGEAVWKTTGTTGQIDFGRIVVSSVTTSC